MPKTQNSRQGAAHTREPNQYHWTSLFDPEWVAKHKRVIEGDNELQKLPGDYRPRTPSEREEFKKKVEQLARAEGMAGAIDKGIKEAR